MTQSKKCSRENCTNVSEWTEVRKKFLENTQEPFLPNTLEQTFFLDLIKLKSGKKEVEFDTLVVYIGQGRIFKLYLNDTNRVSEDVKQLCMDNFGCLTARNGVLTERCLADVINDIEQ